MNYLAGLYRQFQRTFAFDEACYSDARQLVLRLGDEEALRYCRASGAGAKGTEVDRWRGIENAIRDIARPDMPYHL